MFRTKLFGAALALCLFVLSGAVGAAYAEMMPQGLPSVQIQTTSTTTVDLTATPVPTTWGEVKAMYGVSDQAAENTGQGTNSIGGRMTVKWPMGPGELMTDWSGDEGDRTSGAWVKQCGRYEYTHSGADYYARDLDGTKADDFGKPVYASITGQVVLAGTSGGYGKTVVIYDSSRRVMVRVAHLNSISVSYQQWVTAGQYIGTLGCTGTCFGSHLHINGYENIDHFQNGMPVVPGACDSDYYACAIYFTY